MEIATLESLFRKEGIRQYAVQLNEYPPILMIIGNGKVFTTGVTEGDPYDSDNACIELFERDGALFINSYYDEPGTTCTVIDHVLMFRMLKLIAKHMGFTTIELLDGSRKRTATGCEWDLRILNRLYKGEGTLTFYERYGFLPRADPLKRLVRFEVIVGRLSKINQDYLRDKNISEIDKLTEHMYELCNRADFSTAKIDEVPLSDFFKQLTNDIKQAITTSRGITEKEAMSYSFHIDPSLPSRCDLRKAVLPIIDGVLDLTHGTGFIRFTLDTAAFGVLDHSHTGGRRRRTKRRRTRKVTRF
jgi:hypothetical protein